MEIEREARKKMKEERQRKKERKRNKKAKMEKDCLTFQKMNCFSHDSNHWRTPPLWTEPSFCFCMNANNNTYSCLRTINQTHNFLYCEFTTGLVTFYNLKKGNLGVNWRFSLRKCFTFFDSQTFNVKETYSFFFLFKIHLKHKTWKTL